MLGAECRWPRHAWMSSGEPVGCRGEEGCSGQSWVLGPSPGSRGGQLGRESLPSRDAPQEAWLEIWEGVTIWGGSQETGMGGGGVAGLGEARVKRVSEARLDGR